MIGLSSKKFDGYKNILFSTLNFILIAKKTIFLSLQNNFFFQEEGKLCHQKMFLVLTEVLLIFNQKKS